RDAKQEGIVHLADHLPDRLTAEQGALKLVTNTNGLVGLRVGAKTAIDERYIGRGGVGHAGDVDVALRRRHTLRPIQPSSFQWNQVTHLAPLQVTPALRSLNSAPGEQLAQKAQPLTHTTCVSVAKTQFNPAAYSARQMLHGASLPGDRHAFHVYASCPARI